MSGRSAAVAVTRWLMLSCAACGTAGLAGLLWLGPAAQALIVPLAALAALPLLGPYLRRGACRRCRSRLDRALPFCPGCAA